jgi:hypothetical protein
MAGDLFVRSDDMRRYRAEAFDEHVFGAADGGPRPRAATTREGP